MRKLRTITCFLTLGVATSLVAGCNLFKKKQQQKEPLVIPTVDVTSLNINLPTLPTRNVGEIRSDDTYEYIDLYQLSDFHGAVNYESHSAADYIGLPKLATLLDTKRANNPGGTLVLSSGDMFQGSADSNLTRGYMVNYAMHYMGFDAMAVGNHEFDWTTDWLKKNAELTYNGHTIPFLGANIVKDGEIPSYLKKSTVITRGDYKIGVIGIIGSDLESSVLKSALNGYEFTKYDSILATETARLRNEEGCQSVIMLAHESAQHIECTTGVDAVFGGHEHKNKVFDYGGVKAVATLNYGQSLGHISLKFDKTTKAFAGIDVAEYEELKNVSGIADNQDIKSIMDQYTPEINKIKHIKLATADADLKFDGALKNICTSTIFNSATTFVEATNSDIDPTKIVAAFHNVNGGIRSDIAKGDVTYGDIYKSFPFDNEIVLFKITGSEAKNKFSILSKLGCYRIFENKDYFKDNEEYYVVTTDFLAFSEQGFANFRSEELTDEDLIRTGKVVRDEIANNVYQIDQLKNDELLYKNDYHYKSIPIIF